MRHQYLGVKQKIRISDTEYDWNDGENHWENFLKYKEVFGDVELEVKGQSDGNFINTRIDFGADFGDEEERSELFGEIGVMGLIDSEEIEEEEEQDEEEDEELGDNVVGLEIKGDEFRAQNAEKDYVEDSGFVQRRKLKDLCGKKLKMLGSQVLELRDVMLRREEKRKEREWIREDALMGREQRRRELELRKESLYLERDEKLERREIELEERQMAWARREYDRRIRLEREIDEERRRRMKLEERLEEEKLEWREKMVGMQIEHEKQMTQMYTDFCQNQLQVLGIVSRLMCQFFGNASDGLGTMGALPPQVLQNLQHPGGLGDIVKPDPSSPSEFL